MRSNHSDETRRSWVTVKISRFRDRLTIPRPRRQGYRMMFAAPHESAFGPKRTLIGPLEVVPMN
jgi:hypothetical protein